MSSGDMPQRATSFRFDDDDLARLARLTEKLRGRSQRDVISMALIHLEETIARDEKVHLVPGESESEGET